MWYENVAGRFFGLVTKHTCDGQTDGQNYDSQDRASTAASRCKKGLIFEKRCSILNFLGFAQHYTEVMTVLPTRWLCFLHNFSDYLRLTVYSASTQHLARL